MTIQTPLARGARRALVLLTGLVATIVVAAGPAAAVPERWSDPDPVTGTQALVVFLLAPLAVVAVTVFLVLAPRWAGAAKAAPAVTAVEAHTGLDELLSPDRPAELEAPAEPETSGTRDD